jgi:hypothetical protein
MSPITKFAAVAQHQKPASIPIALKVQSVAVCEPSPVSRVEIDQQSFDCIGVRRRGNKSFVLRFETKDAENFAVLFQ